MSNDDDVIGELFKNVKELSEKNFSLTLKVNELEKKIEQTELNKNDISSLKANVDAANTDRTAIKDLLNLKITETKNLLDDKINSFKKDFSYLKEDMNSLGSQNSEITTKIEQLSTEVHESLKVLSEETVKNFQTLKEDFNSKLQTTAESIIKQKTELEQAKVDLNNNLESLSTAFKSADEQLLESVNQNISTIANDVKTQSESTAEQFEKSASEIATELQQLSEDLTNNQQKSLDEITTKFDNQQSLITNLSSQTDITVNGINRKIDKFFDISNNHSEVLKVFEEIIGQINANIDQANQEVKKDQELLLESFQKIIVGQAENLRNELLTFSKEIRTNLSKFNDDIASKFTPIDETLKLNERVKALDADLHSRSENIRSQLIETLEENVEKFDSSIKNSISSVDEYRVDLERFKDDIESLIERKVNEKTEFSMELFNNLLTKAEYISKLVLDAKVAKVPKIESPIPEIKDTNSESE